MATSPETSTQPADAAPVAAASTEAPVTPAERPAGVSDIARAQQAKRLAAAKAKPAAPVAVAPPAPTRAQILAELKAAYEADPEALVREVAGEDFKGMAARVAKKEAPPTPEEVQAGLLARLKAMDEEKAAAEAEKAKATQAEASARTAAHIAEISKLMEATNAEGEHLYPTLATLDPTSVDEDPGVTAYNAVVWAWEQEGIQPDGSFVPVTWDEATTKSKFEAAFEGLEAHYAKIRTPKPRSAQAQTSPSDEDPSPTITSTRAVSEPRHKEPPASMTIEQAIRFHAKQLGIAV